MAGGLEGEFYKGLIPGSVAPSLLAGVRLHRAIDAYTDSHAGLIPLREAFPQGSRRYAGILIDLAFDHYLCQHWSRFSNVPLQRFTTKVYAVLKDYHNALSPAAARMADRLQDYSLLERYADWSMVPATAERIGQRFKRANPLVNSAAILAPLQDRLERHFLSFYPELQAFSRETATIADPEYLPQ